MMLPVYRMQIIRADAQRQISRYLYVGKTYENCFYWIYCYICQDCQNGNSFAKSRILFDLPGRKAELQHLNFVFSHLFLKKYDASKFTWDFESVLWEVSTKCLCGKRDHLGIIVRMLSNLVSSPWKLPIVVDMFLVYFSWRCG